MAVAWLRSEARITPCFLVLRQSFALLPQFDDLGRNLEQAPVALLVAVAGERGNRLRCFNASLGL